MFQTMHHAFIKEAIKACGKEQSQGMLELYAIHKKYGSYTYMLWYRSLQLVIVSLVFVLFSVSFSLSHLIATLVGLCDFWLEFKVEMLISAVES